MINLRENKKLNAPTGSNYNRYLVDIQFKSIKYLSKQDEIRPFKQLNTKNDEDARTTIVKATQPLVIAIANKLHSRKYPIEELICVGNDALSKYMDKFDVTRGYRFTSFIVKYISGSMMMEIRKAKDDVSLDATTEEGVTLLDIIPSTEIPLIPVSALIDEELKKALDQLEPLEKEILCRQYGLFGYEKMTQMEQQHVYDIDVIIVRMHAASGMKKLRKNKRLKNFLKSVS